MSILNGIDSGSLILLQRHSYLDALRTVRICQLCLQKVLTKFLMARVFCHLRKVLRVDSSQLAQKFWNLMLQSNKCSGCVLEPRREKVFLAGRTERS